MNNTHTVLRVEDQAPTRERLARVIEGHPRLDLVAAVGNCTEARQVLTAHKPNVLLTDLDLPDGNGLELIRETHADNSTTEIMVITVFGDEKHVISAIEAGASGYLLKDGSSDYIGQSIMQMLAGGSPISASIARFLLKHFKAQTQTPAPTEVPVTATMPKLTERETDVLTLVAKGFTYNEIGDLLGVSVHTVTTPIKQIYRKLAVKSRGEAVFEAMQRGLIQIND